ncbi:MAG: ABC transporter ATP-binding protein [Candidatus Brocadia sp.]|nr:Vitamin B12 import ATP-binding protein BtuD [Candidatus Brocadia fulgida]MCC6326141.1 ABC transporter ATP-binding protein [Candidatus Brocadia sp.]MCE7912014.1 ABC transporter ATP-binding protein [Candidatus Brocadia sp. AMX3]MDG5995483.1 ABC transporter ATP-binding protein [Candidatus Brocadia sp.]RIJ88658.1 MAG: ABC transporter ATP-binding protein [Candidatus Brocadia sp.]
MTAILTVESASKRYRIQRHRPTSIKDSIIGRLKGLHRKDNFFWALRDVSFSVEHGLKLGIIGHNGAGKSTLLRLLCGLGRPTTGRIHCKGQVSGLLELGSGFHPDMTGRENLVTGGILSGLTKRQVLAKQEEIIAFAELEECIDHTVRTYSSGMYLRLAFAAAIHFDPDVLIIDEVLAVGDSRFQKKCLERLASFQAKGKTTILTSHDTDQIRNLCDEVLVLEEGRAVMLGDPEKALQCYNDLMRQRTEKRAALLSGGATQTNLVVEHGSRMGTLEASVCAVRLYDTQRRATNTIHSGDSLIIELEYRLTKPLPDVALTLGIYTEANTKCFEFCVASAVTTVGSLTNAGRLRCQLPELPLLPGLYYLNIGLYPPDWNYVYDYHWQMHPLHVLSASEGYSGISGVISVKPVWSVVKE